MTISHRSNRLRHHRDRAAVASEASSVREPYGISQMFAAAFGVFFIVLGAVGLARGGMESMTSPHVRLMGMGMTPLLALIHLVLGIIALASAVSRSSSRAVGTMFGAGLIALGIIALIQPIEELGWTDANGVAYLISGVLGIAAAAATPALEVSERRVMVDETDDAIV